MTEELAVAGGVAALRVVEALDRRLRHEQRQHRADALDPAEAGQSLLQPGTASLESLVDLRITQPPQYGEAGGGRKGVPGQRPGLVDVPDRRQPLHQLRAPAEG